MKIKQTTLEESKEQDIPKKPEKPIIQTKKEVYKPILTLNKYDMFDILSSLQKSIRLSRPQDALYWAHELLESNMGGQLWSRLTIISVEDMSGLIPVVAITTMKKLYYDLKDKKPEEAKLIALKATRELAINSHDRTVDDYLIYRKELERRHQFKLKPIPQIAYDGHTRTGKQLGRGLLFFIEKSSKLTRTKNYNKKYKRELKKLLKKQL